MPISPGIFASDPNLTTRWRSAGDGRYEIEDAERAEVGTTVTLHLRAADPESGLPDYSDAWTLRRILRRYSDFVAHPITLQVDGKWEEGGEKLAEVSIWTENSDGSKTTPGQAVVAFS